MGSRARARSEYACGACGHRTAGEIGLTGAIRPVADVGRRLSAAAAAGAELAVGAAHPNAALSPGGAPGTRLHHISSVEQALEAAFAPSANHDRE